MTLFYYSIVATLAILVVIIAESLITAEPIRFWAYTSEQYLFICLTCFVNYVGMNF